MKAMIFAAGVGSRLKPFTDYHPKALAPIGGIPALERVLLKVKEAGINDVVINVHHFANQIMDFIESRDAFGMDIKISDETDCLLDTGGGLLKAQDYLSGSEPVLLHNADIVTDIPLKEMEEFYFKTGADVALLVSPRHSSRILYFSNDNSLQGWKNLNTGKTIPDSVPTESLIPVAFGGVHIISPAIFPLLREYSEKVAGKGNPFSIISFYLYAISKLKIYGWQMDESFRWFDIGTSEKLAAADAAFMKF